MMVTTRIASLALLLALLLPGFAHAKKVSIQWKPMSGAVDYELELQGDGQEPTLKNVQEPAWKGDLPFGFYSYRVRATDKLKRPGAWSPPRALIVMPPPPKPLSPDDGDSITLFDQKVPLRLKWSESPGATGYVVEVKQGRNTILSTKVKETETLVQLPAGSAAGSYSWKVMAVVEPQSRAPASFSNRSWTSEANATESFKVSMRQLEAPTLIWPKARFAPKKSGRVNLRWKAVDGAERYEVRLTTLSDDSRRGLASGGATEKTYTVDDNELELELPKRGTYRWQVQALANLDDSKVAGAIGPKSVADFKIDPNVGFTDGSGYVALSTKLAPYTYKIRSEVTGKQATFGSTSSTMGVTGEYWPQPYFGGAFGLAATQFSVQGRNVTRSELSFDAKMRLNLSKARHGWVVIPKAGLELRQYPELRPSFVGTVSSFNLSKTETLGSAFGVDVRKQFNERMSIGLTSRYFVPLTITSTDGDLSGHDNYRNLSIGVQGIYWTKSRWGLGAGGYIDWRSLRYQTNGLNPVGSRAHQTITMDGVYFFGSLIYSLGR